MAVVNGKIMGVLEDFWIPSLETLPVVFFLQSC
jgi:hypothetical protein